MLVLGGSSSYTYVRMYEMKKNSQEDKKLLVIEEPESDAQN